MKAKKALAITLSAALAGLVSLSFCSCDWFSSVSGGKGNVDGGKKNPYEVATDLGYGGNVGEWLSGAVSSDSEARRMYEEARADGYQGTFLDFLKELNWSTATDDASSVAAAVTSAVSITSEFSVYNTSSRRTESAVYAGAGVVYSLDKNSWDAYIVTNYHVIYDAKSTGREEIEHISDNILVYLYGGETAAEAMAASYVGGAMDYDIAVLFIDGDKTVNIVDSSGTRFTHENGDVLKKSSARAISAADSDAISVGQRVYAIGNPKGEGMSVTSGVVSVDAEYIDIKSSDEKKNLSLLEMRIDAAINHGNSGGGLFDKDGKLVGIVNARSEETGVTAFGYAIPANLALSIAQNIIDNAPSGSRGALRATLGITVMTADSSSVYDATAQKTYIMETVTVQGVQSGAAASSLKAGDVFYSVKVTSHNDNERVNKVITRRHQIYSILFNMRLGDTLEITVSRGDELVTEKVVYSESSQFTLFD